MPEPDRVSGSPGRRRLSQRLDKSAWLERSLRLLEKRGPAALTLDSLTKHLGVTTGSFYWHFKSHARFLDELTDRYIEQYTHVVGERLATLDLPPRDMLREAMRQIIEQGLGGMDVHFRSLAITYPRLRRKLKAMDTYRTAVITGLFEAMGYTGDELRMRVHTFVVLHSMESGVNTNLSPQDRLTLINERMKLLID